VSPPLTPTEHAIYAALPPGQPVPARALLARLHDGDDEAGRGRLQYHVCNLRRKMPPGEAIGCLIVNGETFYQRIAS
jgi:DNA-binding response OmpR family regulator